MSLMYVNNKSEFDLLTLKFEKNAKMKKMAHLGQFARYLCGLNCKSQFETKHGMLELAFGGDLQFKVKYRAKFGTWVKFTING